jgi:hypothetical protein
VRQRPFILFLLAVSLTGAAAISARAQDQPATPAPNPDKPQQPPANSPTPTAAPDENHPQKGGDPVPKPHHVITNDDLSGKGDALGGASADIDISNINYCDRNCFEMVRRGAPGLADPAGRWKHELLHEIDKVTADAKWQAALAGLASAKGRFCRLDREKAEALANKADAKKVTEQELSIDEEFDRKYTAAQAALNDAFAEADAQMRGYSGIVVPFMNLQKGRVSNAPCIQPEAPRYRPYQRPVDDPDDP